MRETQESREMRREITQPKPEGVRPRRRGFVLILLALVLLVLVGMVGLAVDLGVAYFLKARLSQAADAASLAGARSLSRGADITTQTASAQAVATNFFNANFPNGFWGSTTSLTLPVVTENDTTKIRYVTVSATATIPLYFLRVFGVSTLQIGTSAQAARRDANIMLILDRSGSMSSAIAALTTDADWFVNQFAVGRDKVGLVTFGGTYTLIKPTTTFTTGTTNVPAAINTLTSSTVGGTTNHAQPLWVAYQALAEANEPGALNAIVFFTDGQPNTITADWSTKDGTTLNLKKPTTCNNGTTGSGASLKYLPVIGYALTYTNGAIGGLFATPYSLPTYPYPPYQPNSISAGTVPSAYISTAYDSSDSSQSAELRSMVTNGGCSFYSNVQNVASDFTQIPTSDYYGNLTSAATKYKSVTLTSFDGTNLTAAAFNAGDYAAQRMRAGALGTPTAIVPLIDTIGLNDGYAIDSVYMNRLANTVNSPIYNSAYPTGIYQYATSTADLQSAFVQIASQILHLSQ
jgi:Flp pilus assembly protein TadG